VKVNLTGEFVFGLMQNKDDPLAIVSGIFEADGRLENDCN